MKIAVDFDGTIVKQDRPYDDLESPLEFLSPDVPEQLLALKRAGNILILWSGRANLSLRKDWKLDPLKQLIAARAGDKRPRWEDSYELNERRFQQMLDFVDQHLPRIFDVIDDGYQGKVSADVYFDDRAERSGTQDAWHELVLLYGEPVRGNFQAEDGS